MEPHKVDLVFKTASELTAAIKAIKDKDAARKKALKPSKDEADLLKAAESGDTTVIKALLAKGVNVNRGGRFEYGRYPFIAKGVTALMLAAEKGRVKALRVLLDAGADVNLPAEITEPGQSGKTALGYACFAEQIEAARLLLGAGANPNLKLSHGQSIFDEVCSKNSIEMIQLLLASGANPDAAVGKAVKANRLDVLKLLLKDKANANGADSIGETALMKASDLLRPEMVHVLLKAGADVTLKTKNSKAAALHQAVQRASWLEPSRKDDAEKIPAAMEIIKALLEKGADPHAPDGRGETPSAMATGRFCKLPELAAHLGAKR